VRPRCRQRGLEQGVRGRHYLRLAPRALDLIGVLVGVARIDAQPVLCSVTAAFRMSAYDAPVCVGHTVDELRASLARPAHRLERRLDWSVGGEALGECLLVVSVDDLLGLCERSTDAVWGRGPSDWCVVGVVVESARGLVTYA